MFQRKYVFETNETKFFRKGKNLLLSLFIAFVIYTVSCLLFIMFSNDEHNTAEEAFFKRSPDLIVVFTGDIGRIPHALKRAVELNQSKILISGVYSSNTVESLLTNINPTDPVDSNQLEIDYQPKNTVENVISTLRYLRKNKNLNNILIISHDYHIMRIKITMDKIKSADDKFQFFYSGIKTDYTQWRNIKILYKEVFKLIRAYAFMSMWDAEIPEVN